MQALFIQCCEEGDRGLASNIPFDKVGVRRGLNSVWCGNWRKNKEL